MSEIKIPYHGLKRFYENNRLEILNKIDNAFCDGQFLKGDENKKLEHNIAKFCNRKYAHTVSSCTDALYFALKSLGIETGDEVIVTNFSFISSATSILRAGAKPVFVDIDADSFLMDLSQIENVITKNTKAIIAVQLFGQTLDFIKLESIAKKHDILIVEDAAQSLGSEKNNRKSGSLGDLSCVSFDPTKIIGAFGTGGAILTDNQDIYNRLKLFTSNGKRNNDFIELAYNSQITTAQASLLDWQLENIEEIIDKRQNIAKQYNEYLKAIDEIKTPNEEEGCKHIYHKYVIQTNRRDELQEHLKNNEIQTLIHYSHILENNSVFTKSNSIKNNSNIAEKLSKEVLSLPIYPELLNEEILYICNSIKSFFNK